MAAFRLQPQWGLEASKNDFKQHKIIYLRLTAAAGKTFYLLTEALINSFFFFNAIIEPGVSTSNYLLANLLAASWTSCEFKIIQLRFLHTRFSLQLLKLKRINSMLPNQNRRPPEQH